jgi:hypothetical protein
MGLAVVLAIGVVAVLFLTTATGICIIVWKEDDGLERVINLASFSMLGIIGVSCLGVLLAIMWSIL